MTNKFDEHNSCDHGCDCGSNCNCDHEHEHEYEEMDVIYLTLDDGSEMECGVLGIFEVEDKSYIALIPLEDEQILLYEYIEEGEEFELGQIESEEEFELVSEAFNALFLDDEEYDEDDFEDEDED
ncbi:DUF1292 domain-containing protein [Anaerosalibacter sp. Marseille-P3206]|uniref:DUF1292 domain-containing protein n=1 Tax=Anaerosalibacter sp. Marseille-P3206 TaxID=1871005 RepID=UPI0009851926|nr:DUF1292 domain-containing protein [Anaerosalibacter sp. Marseille-P3206]